MSENLSGSEEGGAEGSLYNLLNSKTYTFDRKVLYRILALWVQDPTFLAKHRRFCKAAFFSHGDLWILADRILRHFDKNFGPPDSTILSSHVEHYVAAAKSKKLNLQEILQLAAGLYKLQIGSNKTTLTDWVLEFGKIEQTKIGMKRIVDLLKEGNYEHITDVMTQLTEYYRVSDFEDADGAFIEDSLDADLANRHSRVKDRVPTGVTAIDEYLGGGLGLGQLYVIVGGTGIGKSTAVMNFVKGAVEKNVPALLISTELQRPRMVDKFHALVSGVQMGMPMIENEEEVRKKLKGYLETRKRIFHLVWFEPLKATVDDVKRYVEGLKTRFNFFPKLIAIDSPDLLKAQRRHQKEHEALAEIYTSLFAMTGRDNIAMLVSSDVKQASRDKILVGVTDMGGAYEKGKKADGVFGLGQDPEHRKVDPLKGTFRLWCNIDKMRTDGTSGPVLEVEVNPTTATWMGLVKTLSTSEIEAGTKTMNKKVKDAQGVGAGNKTPDKHV